MTENQVVNKQAAPDDQEVKNVVGFAFLFPAIILSVAVCVAIYKIFQIDIMLIIGGLYLLFVFYEYKFGLVLHSNFSTNRITYETKNKEKFKLHLTFHFFIAVVFTLIGLYFQITN